MKDVQLEKQSTFCIQKESKVHGSNPKELHKNLLHADPTHPSVEHVVGFLGGKV